MAGKEEYSAGLVSMVVAWVRNEGMYTRASSTQEGGEGTGARGATGPRGRMSGEEARLASLTGVTRASRACE
jgi:hypothetical protein